MVVSGFYPSATARESVLQLFLSFGDILDHVVTPGNWLFIRYEGACSCYRRSSGAVDGTAST